MDLYAAMPRRVDALFELSGALLRAEGPVRALVVLALASEHRRSHGSLYAALNQGDLDAYRFRRAMAARSLPRGPGGRIVLAVDCPPGCGQTPGAVTPAPSATPTADARTPTRWCRAGPTPSSPP